MSYSRMRQEAQSLPTTTLSTKAKKWLGIGSLLGVAALSVIFSTLFDVHERERAVITRNGAFLRVSGPGLDWKMPFIDGMEIVSIQPRVLRLEKLETFTTGDQPQHVDLEFVVQWQVEPAYVERVFRLGRDPEVLLRTMITDRAKEAVGRRHANAIPAERGAIRDEVAQGIRTEAQRLYGVTLIDLQLVNFDYSQAFRRAVDEASVAQQRQAQATADAVSAQEKAKGEANAEIERARGQAASRLAVAEAEARAIRLRGEAEAAALTAQNRALAEAGGSNLVALRQAERWDGKLPTQFIPGSTVPFLDLNGRAPR